MEWFSCRVEATRGAQRCASATASNEGSSILIFRRRIYVSAFLAHPCTGSPDLASPKLDVVHDMCHNDDLAMKILKRLIVIERACLAEAKQRGSLDDGMREFYLELGMEVPRLARAPPAQRRAQRLEKLVNVAWHQLTWTGAQFVRKRCKASK